MKQISLIFPILFTLAFSKINAQAVSVGVTAGFNFQNINGKSADGNDLKNQLVPRYALGLTVPISLTPEYVIQPGVLFTTKGAKSQDGATNTNSTYIEVPVNFIYKPQLMGGSVLLGFGPYVGIGLGGNEKTDKSGVSLERSIKYKSSINAIDLLNTSEVYYKPIDAGVNLLAGYEFSNGFSFQVNAQLGLTNINPDINGSTTDKTALKNTGFGISLGYRIRK